MRQRAQSILRTQGCAAGLRARCRRQPRLRHRPGSYGQARGSPASHDGGVRNVTRGTPCKASCAGALVALPVLTLPLPSATVMAQTGYRYRDANGHWVFTDRAPASGTANDSFSLGPKDSTLHLAVDRSDDAESTQLTAVNACLCVVTFAVSIIESGVAAIPEGANYRATLEPGTRQILVRGTRTGTAQAGLRYAWRAALGSPDAVHNPPRPYRVPFGVGS